MKRFSFPLRRVLEFRRQQEELEIGRVQALAGLRGRLEQQASQMREESRQWRAGCATVTHITGSELAQAFQYAHALGEAREQTLTRAEQVEMDRRRQMEVVVEARRRVRLLELLRARKFTQHARLTGREEEILATEAHLARMRREEKNIP